MNVVILIGRLTRDPELKYGQSGKAYARFSIAVDNPFKKDDADFINCVAFGKTAELIGEYLRKGKKVGVNGRLQMNRYEVNGEKKTSYDVLVEQVEFLESKGESSDRGANFGGNFQAPRAAEAAPVKAPTRPAPVDEPSFDDDEFPF